MRSPSGRLDLTSTYMLCTYTDKSRPIIVYLLDEALLITFSSLSDNNFVARCKSMRRLFY